MQKFALYTSILALVGSASAIVNPNLKPAFADLTWYSDRSAVKQQMISKGYVYVRDLNQNGAIDSLYSGKILGVPVVIQQWFNSNNQLTKTSIVFEKDYDTNLYNTWTSIKKSIDSKYGQGVDVSNISPTSKQYSWSLDSELNSGKEVSTFWLFPVNKYSISVDIRKVYTADEENYVSLSYESPAWSKELSRRNQDSDF